MWVYIFTLAFFSDAVGAVGITFDALIRDAGVSKVRVLLSDVLFDRKELINLTSRHFLSPLDAGPDRRQPREPAPSC